MTAHRSHTILNAFMLWGYFESVFLPQHSLFPSLCCCRRKSQAGTCSPATPLGHQASANPAWLRCHLTSAHASWQQQWKTGSYPSHPSISMCCTYANESLKHFSGMSWYIGRSCSEQLGGKDEEFKSLVRAFFPLPASFLCDHVQVTTFLWPGFHFFLWQWSNNPCFLGMLWG